MIPKPNSTSNKTVDVKNFFRTGYNIIEGNDTGTRQHVVTKLAEETGLQTIRQLVECIEHNQGTFAISTFTECTLPFFRIISHPGVLSSLLLENQVAIIYTFLFGPAGQRGLTLFRLTSNALGGLVQRQNIAGDHELSGTAVSSTLAVLDRMIEINQTAQVIDGFSAVVQTILTFSTEDVMVVSAQQSLARIKRRLNIGSSLPVAPARSTTRSVQNTSFELAQDLPGTLSQNGPRHDNDHADIGSIKILPTTEEIASPRQEYLPFVESTQTHLSGLPELLDRQFRLLREDTVGQLRDAVREEIGRLSQARQNNRVAPPRQEMRRLVYHNVRFRELLFDRKRGLQVVAEFDQPQQVKKKSARQREEWWRSSKLLQTDSLVCFVSAGGRVVFFSVSQATPPRLSPNDSKLGTRNDKNNKRRVDEISSLFYDPVHASVLLSLADYNEADAVWVATHVGIRPALKQTLVEFPGILLPSFQPTLQALQKMGKSLDLPFAGIVAPDSNPPLMQPPAYAARNFRFNLDILAGEPLTLTPGQVFDFQKMQESSSSLDEAQQHAVIQALSAGLALIQGPPGTGKSYTGVSIIKALLHNRNAAKLGPIICVCYTNHALDQLLEHLVEDSVQQIIRMGSRSKSDVLQNVTLHNVRKQVEPSNTEKSEKWKCNRSINDVLEEVEEILPGLNDASSLANIKAHLQTTHQRHYNELFGGAVDEDGFMEVKGRKFKVVEAWLRNAPKKITTDRPISQLSNISLKAMSAQERLALYKHWIKQHTTQLTEELIHAMDSYHKSKIALDKCHGELDLRCLQEAHVIGVTTSGLARNLDLLQRVGAKVMICEEAGEVLEAHTLTAFLPGIEHAILIGDHEQLRPQINNYELQHDNPRGKKYSLDVSLFERLVKSAPPRVQVPLSALKIQRRMHPSISELVRVPLYPDLLDHASVTNYPEVNGMRSRLYWLDHQEVEDSRSDQMVSLSKTNTFEVEMVAALVSHLVRQGTYASGEIAVITPYLGQLQKIRKRLATSFEIVVGDRDQEDLEAEGLEDGAEEVVPGQVQVRKTTLLNALRVATVDNFQGEEAKVIVISLVRSNENRKCGFLKTSNRINVLLSRAQYGMYIIGNSDTARPVPMWNEVISILERDNNIGQSLALRCPRHKDTPIEVSTPDDFVRFAPEGGCAEKCIERLPCGHSCVNRCHSIPLHNVVRCLERCPRPKKGCEHECLKVCGDPCDERCQAPVFNFDLPCGHTADKLKCYEAQAPEEYSCHALVPAVVKRCKHKISLQCHQLPLSIDHPCSAKCGAVLTCGHTCTHTCKDCNVNLKGVDVKKNHGVCDTRCGRLYTTCGHSCQAKCHGDEPCPPCEARCQVSCNHSRCSKPCHEPCAPCAENCSWSCPHIGLCPLPCAIPCDLLPCSERCAEILSCGHRCPSTCGEVCPSASFCQTCASPSIKGLVVDFIMLSTFEEIDLDETPCIVPSCGHIQTLDSMDGHMSMKDFYNFNEKGTIVGLKNNAEPFSASDMKRCPTCRTSLRSLNRYGRISRRSLIDEATKKFIVWGNNQFVPLVTEMQELEAKFRETSAKTPNFQDAPPNSASAPSGILELCGTRDKQFSHLRRLMPKDKLNRSITKLRQNIRKFLDQVDEKEQPFGRIYDLAQDARRHRGVEVDLDFKVEILQVRSRLLTTVLLIRCDYNILCTFLAARENDSSQKPQIDLTTNRQDCEDLIGESTSRNQPASAVEGHLYWARFLALERKFPRASVDLADLLEDARGHVQIAKSMCDQYPRQTAGMRDEAKDVEKMLRGSTFYLPVTNDEKAAVYAAMARDFRGTGHWYYCENGHPFTVGECGMPMQTSRCPQCGASVGGQDHQAVAGVRHADDLDRQFGGLNLR